MRNLTGFNTFGLNPVVIPLRLVMGIGVAVGIALQGLINLLKLRVDFLKFMVGYLSYMQK